MEEMSNQSRAHSKSTGQRGYLLFTPPTNRNGSSNVRVFEYGGRMSVPRMDEEASAAAKLFQFLPARQNGVAVPIIVRIEIHFE
jgi:hypothetical protein